MSMVTATADSLRPVVDARVSWRAALRRAIRDPRALCRALRLSEQCVAPATRAAEEFGLFAPWEFIARMEKGNADDPLLRQVLPLDAELRDVPGFSRDPVGDLPAARGPGLLRKYAGRVLLVLTGACPVHCRYCFRRHFPYGEVPHSLDAWQPAFSQIAADASIEEVILSGGDPLMLVDEALAGLAGAIAEIPHVRRLRVHTRMPIMIPQRVTPELVDWLTRTRLTPVVVVHANHPREIDASVAAALIQLADGGVTLLNQAVLLRGINDDAAVQIELSRRLLDCRVLPYYLHQLDRVAGAAHFEVPEDAGRRIIDAIRRQLPGYAVPRYVREAAGEASKQLIE